MNTNTALATPTAARPTAENVGESRVSIGVRGMTCAGCVRSVQQELDSLPGVRFASVNLATERAYVVGDDSVTEHTVAQAIDRAGYRADRSAAARDAYAGSFLAARRRLIIALGGTIPIAAFMIVHMLGAGPTWYPWSELIASTLVIAAAGGETFRSAWIAVRHRHSNMSVLLVLGMVAALVGSALHLVGVSPMPFAAIAPMILTLHLAGKRIEAGLKRKATEEVRRLAAMQPTVAHVRTADGALVDVPADTLLAGTEVVLRNGDAVPADGVLIEGAVSADEALVTGESAPVDKPPQSPLLAGTTVVAGSGVLRVEHTGEDAFLGRMTRLVEEAQASTMPVQALADRLTNIFVPLVVALATIAGLAWGLFYRALGPVGSALAEAIPWVPYHDGPVAMGIFAFIATLVISCPCALGLATPIALAVATGVSASAGLLVKDGAALQAIHTATTAVVDKTGTLTEGRPLVVEHTLAPRDLAAVATIEAYSSHPLARAIVRFATEHPPATAPLHPDSAGEGAGTRPGTDPAAPPAASLGTDPAAPPAENVTETPGSGITGTVGGSTYTICAAPQGDDTSNQARTVLAVTRDGAYIGTISLADAIRPEATETIAHLRADGVRLILASGDGEATVRAVAQTVGIDEAHPSMKPDDKLTLVQNLVAGGERVVFVGDGINDAAALKAATVGVAMGSGGQAAIESADIVIPSDDLRRVLLARRVSHRTLRAVKANLFWALAYNVLAIPAAMAGLLHPAIAEAAMVVSSMSVLAAAVVLRARLRREAA